MPTPQISICKTCKNCLHYTNPEQVKDDSFHVVGYQKGINLFNESGAVCGVAGITVKMNILQCQMFNERRKKYVLLINIAINYLRTCFNLVFKIK